MQASDRAESITQALGRAAAVPAVPRAQRHTAGAPQQDIQKAL